MALGQGLPHLRSMLSGRVWPRAVDALTGGLRVALGDCQRGKEQCERHTLISYIGIREQAGSRGSAVPTAVSAAVACEQVAPQRSVVWPRESSLVHHSGLWTEDRDVSCTVGRTAWGWRQRGNRSLHTLPWPERAYCGGAGVASRLGPLTIVPPVLFKADMSTAAAVDAIKPAEELRVAVFSAARYVLEFLEQPLKGSFPCSRFLEVALSEVTAPLAQDSDVVCLFVNDIADAKVVQSLAEHGVKGIAMRCAGYDRVDLDACAAHGIRVMRVPAYSPQSVAEHAVALMFALNRHLHTSYMRTQQGNYALSGMIGTEMFNKVVGVVGTGAIGAEACRILVGIGCRVVAYDVRPNPRCEALGVRYCGLDELLAAADVVTLHCPLLPSTRHLMNRDRLWSMKDGAMLVNVSRGELVDTAALLEAIEAGKLGSVGMDVYQNETALFFHDFTALPNRVRMKFWDKTFKALQTYPQVLMTPHMGFLTTEALANIAATTVDNLRQFCKGGHLDNEVTPQPPAA